MDTRRRIIELAYITVAAMVWLYLWFRAFHVPLAHDEIATFFYYIQTGEFLPSIAHWDANNHILNSALSWLFYETFGHSEVVFRLANLLAFPLMAMFWLLLSKEIENLWLKAGFLFTAILMHNYVEFFALSRGYGLSMGFLVAGVYYLVRFYRSAGLKHLTASLLFILLAVASNLALYTLSLIIYLILAFRVYLLEKVHEKLKGSTWIFLLGIIPAVLFAFTLFLMKDQDLLYYGAQDGFWQITARSLIRMLSGSRLVIHEFFWAVVAAAGLACGAFFLYRSSRSREIPGTAGLFLLLAAGSVLATIALNLLLGVNYPEDRVGLYLYPLFTGLFFMGIDKLPSNRLKIMALLLFIWLPVDFIAKANLTYSECYKTDYIPERFFDRVASARGPGEPPPTVGSYRTRHFVWSYYDYCAGGSKVAPIFHSNYPGNLTEYVLTDLELFPEWSVHYDTIDREWVNGRYLMRRKTQPREAMLASQTALVTGGETGAEYFLVFGMDADTLAGKNLRLDFELEIESTASPFEARLVFSVEDSLMNDLRYEYIQLNWVRKEWSGKIHNTLLMHDIPPGAHYLRFYLWSIEKAPFSVSSGQCILYEIWEN